ncbi:MAG: ribose-phosphate pyrophosphokinase-like domain-containing protein, partial [Desulfurococcaceae archaeon]
MIGYPNYWLAKVIASKLKAIEIDVYDKVFPDGELYVRLANPERVALNKVVIVSTFYPEQEKRILKTMLLIDAAKNNNPSKLIALIPYLAYSRQDKVFLPGEPVSACLIMKLLKNA